MTYVSKCRCCQTQFEWRAARFSSPDPDCPECGSQVDRVPTAAAVIWSKPLSAYQDPRGETTKKDIANSGHFTFERNSERAAEAGKPVRVRIETPQQQREYCKREGLVNPKDIPSNLSVAANGTSYETVNRSEV